MDLSSIDYQEVVDTFVDLMKVGLPIGVIWGLLERLVIMFFDAAMDRWRRRSDL